MKRLALVFAVLVTACFPSLPDEAVVSNLRVLAIQADPAVATFDQYPLPVITVRALVVDPDDPAGEDIEHQWALQLGDEDFDGREQLEALIPAAPHGPKIEIDFGASQGRAEVIGWVLAQLPLGYTATLRDEERETVKLVPFLSPEFEAPPETPPPDLTQPVSAPLPTGPPTGPPPEIPGDSEPEAPELPDEWNENPALSALRLEDGTEWSQDEGTLPGLEAPLYVGSVDPYEGLHFHIEVTDDSSTERLSVELFRTSGSAGLPQEEDNEGWGGPFSTTLTREEREAEEKENRSTFGSGGNTVLDDPLIPREFGWTPWLDPGDRVARLFLVLRDDDGGQSWQEIRPEDPPEGDDDDSAGDDDDSAGDDDDSAGL